MELDGLQELAAERQRREDFFEKAFDPTYIEKGRRAQIGEVRQWKDGKYKRTKEGWEPVREGKSLGSSKLDDAISVAGKALAQGRPDAMDLRKVARDMAMDSGMDPKKFQEALDTSKEAWKNDLGGGLVGKTFNHEGVTYKVTKQGATQSEAEAVTESLKGKKITVDNKVVEKQSGYKKEEPKKSEQFKIGDKVKLEDGYDKSGNPVIREYTITKPGMRRSEDRLQEGELYLTSPGTIGFDVTLEWLKENRIK